MSDNSLNKRTKQMALKTVLIYISDNNLKLVAVATDWESAQNNCINETRILISEMPSVISLANVKPGDVIWVNAKVTRIEYHGGRSNDCLNIMMFVYNFMSAVCILKAYVCGCIIFT